MSELPSLALTGSSLAEAPSLATPDSGLLAPSTLATPSGLDFAGIEKNLSAIRAVEATWRLPALPDEVRLDLASTPGVSPQALSDLLHGTDYDLHGDVEPEPLYSPIQWEDPLQRTGGDQFKLLLAGISSQTAPQEESIDAVKAWKQRAIDQGFLEAPADGVIDNRWDPSFNSIRYEMFNQDFDRSQRGDRPGAVPMSKALDTLNRWTSPSGLLGAAMDLDLFWDVGAISKEIGTWGDKWRKLGKSKNPLDFAGNLIDAVTGPIDDVVFPALNLFLLTTGVSQAVNFGRIAYGSSKAIQAGSLFDKVYETGRLGKALGIASSPFRSADIAADVTKFGQASGLGARLQKSEKALVSTLGDSMNAWRSFTPVKVAKKGVQTGMRLGLTSQTQDLLPGYQGGVSLSNNDAIAKARDRFVKSPFAWGVGEALFTPYTILQPGSFISTLKTGGKAVAGTLGTVGGRAAAGAVVGATAGLAGDDAGDVVKGAAIGAATAAAVPEVAKGLSSFERVRGSKALGHPVDFLQKLSFKPLAQDQRLTAVADQALRRVMSQEEFVKYDEGFQKGGFYGAIKATAGIDEEATGATLGYQYLAYSIDRTATLQAGLINDAAGMELRRQVYRDKLIAQLRSFDVENFDESTMEEMARAASLATDDPRRRAKLYKKTLADLQANPERAFQLANDHNRVANSTLQQLLSLENIPDLDLPDNVGQWAAIGAEDRATGFGEYIARNWDTFANWPRFAENSEELLAINAEGLLDMARYKQVFSPHGSAISVIPEYERPSSSWTEEVSGNVLDHLLTGRDAEWSSKGTMAPLAQSVGLGKPTLAKSDTLTKQDYLHWSKRLQALVKFHDRFDMPAKATAKVLQATGEASELSKRTTRGMSLVESLGDAASELGTFDKARLDQLALASSLSPSDARLLKDINTFVKSFNVDPTDLSGSLRRLVDQTLEDSELSRFGLQRFQEVGEGADKKALEGLDLLRTWRKELQSKAKFKAAEIDVDDLITNLETAGKTNEAARMRTLKEQLDRDGYKLVHGVEFLTPADLQGNTPIFKNITTRHLNAVTLGNFFKGKLPQEAHLAADRRKKVAIATALKKAGNPKGMNLDDLDGPDIEGLLDRFTELTRTQQERAATMLADAKNEAFLRRLAKRYETSSVPTFEADLGLGVNKKLVLQHFDVFGEDVANAMWLAAKSFRNAEFKDLGLYSFEAKLRKRSQLVDTLTVLSGTGNGENTFKRALHGAGTGAIAGAAAVAADQGVEFVAGDDTHFDLGALATGAAIGAGVGAGAASAVTQKVLDRAELSRYGYLADNTAKLRDQLRFTLSPWFDISRFSEAHMLNQLATPKFAKNGQQIVMPLNASPRALIKKIGEGEFKKAQDAFARASRGDYDPNTVDAVGRWFSQVGIAGFDTTKWMTSSFYHLTTQGVGADEAYQIVRNAYTYGTRGRSAAEMSVNFIFFPFSFQKKTLTHAAKWISDDFSRSVMIHDSLKAYELLDEKFDLNERWRDYAPAMEKMRQLNAFAFGISPGRFGGINAPFVDAAKATVMNMFTPQGISIKGAADREVIEKLTRKMLPVWNDAQHLIEDLKEQGHVMFSPTHQTTANQVADAYKEWGEFKAEVNTALGEKGFTMAQMQRNPSLVDAKIAYQQKKKELLDKYPSWGESLKKAAGNAQAANQMKTDAKLNIVSGEGTISDQQVVAWEEQLDGLRAWMDQHGIEEFSDLPPETFDAVHRTALQYSQQNPLWAGIYNRLYGKNFGPLTRSI